MSCWSAYTAHPSQCAHADPSILELVANTPCSGCRFGCKMQSGRSQGSLDEACPVKTVCCLSEPHFFGAMG